MRDKVEKVIVNWLKSNDENATNLAHEICFLLDVVCSKTELAEHKCKFCVNADWSYLKCGCGKRIKPKG
jgi:hypothetical protein